LENNKHCAGVTRYEGVLARQEIDITTSPSRVLESFSTALGELVPQSVACLVSMPHSGVDVIESKPTSRHDWRKRVGATSGLLGSGGLA
jgi:hypothetical protein